VRQLFRMADAPDAPKAAIPVSSKDEARRWNTPELGFGIFATVNDFNGPRRKENLRRINAWPIDIDTGSKAEQCKRINSSPLPPSIVVETKRGYQAYWMAQDGANPEFWNAIVLERLVPFFGADKNARDLCRILRVPGYLHLKDPTDPFMIKTVWQWHVAYTDRQMAEAFPRVRDAAHEQEQRRLAASKARDEARRRAVADGMVSTDTLWDAIWNLDCEDGLRRLSGHWAVGGEQYTFRSTTRGNRNVFVNGKSSSCFIDENKRIGSLDGGGPTLAQWLRWFKHDWKTVIQVLKEIYPHLADVDAANKRAA
jgi:hypothetical protein